ncbi:MAG: glycosyltransferase family 39 protein [Candidatus Kerfeldbacteria bacterium]
MAKQQVASSRNREAREWLFPVVGAAILFFVWLLGSGKELWYSERFVQVLGDQSWGTMFSLFRYENNPPLFFIVARIWESLVGHGEAAARTLPFLFLIASLFALWYGTTRIVGKNVARYAVIITCVSGMLIQQATEYRMYTMLLFFSALAIQFAWMYGKSGENRYLAALTIVHVFGFLTHYTYLALAFFLTLWLLSFKTHHRKQIVIHGALAVALWMPWIVYAFGPLATHPSTTLGIQQQSATPWELLLLPFRTIVPPIFGESLPIFAVRSVVCGVIIGALGAVYGQWKRQTKQSDFRRLVLFLLSGVLFGIVCCSLVRLTLPRYATAFVPFIIMLIASGLSEITKHRFLGTALTGTIILGSLFCAVLQARMPYATYREALKIVSDSERNSDRLLVYPFNDEIAVQPYYTGSLTVSGYFPLQAQNTTTLIDNIRYNFRNTLSETTVNSLSGYVGGAPRVWFLYDVPIADGYFRANLIDQWFTFRGYSKTEYRDAFHNVPPLLVRYERQ